MSKIIYIAAGHGGKDNGASSGAFIEDELNLKVAKYAQSYLKAYDCDVFMSRTTDTGENTIDKRCAEAKRLGAACFLEIHHNAGGGDGCEVYYWKGDMQAKKLATVVAKYFAATGQNAHGQAVKESSPNGHNFGVCRRNSANGIPAILGEFAFVDNAKDRTIIDTEAELKAEGEAYAKAAVEFCGLKKKPEPKPKPVVKPVAKPVTPAFKPYLVKILYKSLNVRKSPSDFAKVVGRVVRGEAFTIVEEKGKWGKLKSGQGWICIKSKYVARVK